LARDARVSVIEAGEHVGDYPVLLGVHAEVLADIVRPSHFGGSGAGEVNRLGTDLVRLRLARASWAHGQ